MDEGKPPREIIKQKNYVIMVFIVMAIAFAFSIKSAVYILIGLILFMFVFSNINKSEEKKHLNKILNYNDDWYVSRYNLSKEIP